MQIIEKQVDLAHRLLPITLNGDGSMSITVVDGLLSNGDYSPVSQRVVTLTADEVSGVCDVEAVLKALGEFLVSKGIVNGTVG